MLLPLVLAVGDTENYQGMAATMLLVAHLFNHPHFASSHQIFHRGFRQRALTRSLGRSMQIRYLIAGVVVPVMLALFFLYVAWITAWLGFNAAASQQDLWGLA